MPRIQQRILPVFRHLVGVDRVYGHTFYGNVLGPTSVVVDLGACEGNFSKYVATCYGCRAYAVEASPTLFAEIEETPMVRKFNYAIAGYDGIASFHESSQKMAGSIIAPKPSSARNVVEVKTRRLSSFLTEIGLTEIDLLKIDIEGAEVPLFNTATDEDIKRIKQITIEFHHFVSYLNISTEDVLRIIRRIKSVGFSAVTMGRDDDDWLFVNNAALQLPFSTRLYLHLEGLIRRCA